MFIAKKTCHWQVGSKIYKLKKGKQIKIAKGDIDKAIASGLFNIVKSDEGDKNDK